MEKLSSYMKKILDYSEIYFLKLNKKERILLIILAFILGFALIYFIFINHALYENKILKEELEFLNHTHKNNQTKLNFKPNENNQSIYNELKIYQKSYEERIFSIENGLKNINALNIELQSRKRSDDDFSYYYIDVKFLSDFHSTIKFLNNLDNTIRVKKINFTKEQNKLKIHLKLIFALA